MGKLRILSSQGDETVVWDEELVKTGDPEALEAVREAERIFEEKRRRGAIAFQVLPDTPPQKLERFDPEATQIILVPRVVGG
jgi:hypothetical protein